MLIDLVLVLLGLEVLLFGPFIDELLEPLDIGSVPDLLHPVVFVQILILQRLVAAG